MRLSHLHLSQFRNFESAQIEPHPRINVFSGENGQGKTNLIESIYWLATLRPLRARRLKELVRWGAPATRVDARVEAEGLTHRLAVGTGESGQRVCFREDKALRSQAYFGALTVVDFSPDDVGLVRAAPQDRRRYLDRACFNEWLGQLPDALSYRQALEVRNHLLRSRPDPAMLAAYEGPMAQAAARLILRRRAWVEAIGPRFATAFAHISGPELAVGLRYRETMHAQEQPPPEAQPSPGAQEGLQTRKDPAGEPEVEALSAQLSQQWAQDRARDRERGFTQRGPHADDLLIELDGRLARNFASQGQQRALVLSLKIAEIEQLIAHRGIHPVLLLDDVSSELDPRRTARLFEFVDGFEGQIFISTTDEAFLRLRIERRVWSICAGTIRTTRG